MQLSLLATSARYILQSMSVAELRFVRSHGDSSTPGSKKSEAAEPEPSDEVEPTKGLHEPHPRRPLFVEPFPDFLPLS